MSMISATKIPLTKKTKVPIAKQLGIIRTQLEDLRDYVELLEARIENNGKPRYSLEEAKRKLQV